MSKPFAPVRGDDKYLVPEADHPCDIVVYTAKWTDDHPTAPDELATSLLNCRIFINGEEVERQAGISFRFGNDFLYCDLHLIASDLKVIPLDKDEWRALGREEA